MKIICSTLHQLPSNVNMNNRILLFILQPTFFTISVCFAFAQSPILFGYYSNIIPEFPLDVYPFRFPFIHSIYENPRIDCRWIRLECSGIVMFICSSNRYTQMIFIEIKRKANKQISVTDRGNGRSLPRFDGIHSENSFWGNQNTEQHCDAC